MFGGMMADMEFKKKLFLRGRKLNIVLIFIWQSCFKVPKPIRLNAAYLFW